jgi:Domain of unknown function (DUF4190)
MPGVGPMTSWPDGPVPGNGDADQRRGVPQADAAQDRIQLPPPAYEQPSGLAQAPAAWGQPAGWAQPGYAVAQPATNGMAIASLVLGITSIVFSWWGLVTLLQVVLAIVFGCVGLSRANQGTSGRGPAIAGLICGCVGAMIYFVIGILSLGIGFII